MVLFMISEIVSVVNNNTVTGPFDESQELALLCNLSKKNASDTSSISGILSLFFSLLQKNVNSS